MNLSEGIREGRPLFIDVFAIVTHFESPPLDKANPAHLGRRGWAHSGK